MKSITVGILFLSVAIAGAAGLPKNTLQAIIHSLQDPNAEVRIAAAQAIAEMPDDNATKPLESALIASSEAAEQDALAKALVAINDRATAKRLSDDLGNTQLTWGNGAKAKAVDVIGKIGERKMLKNLSDLVTSEQEPAVRAAAIRSLTAIGAPPKKPEKK